MVCVLLPPQTPASIHTMQPPSKTPFKYTPPRPLGGIWKTKKIRPPLPEHTPCNHLHRPLDHATSSIDPCQCTHHATSSANPCQDTPRSHLPKKLLATEQRLLQEISQNAASCPKYPGLWRVGQQLGEGGVDAEAAPHPAGPPASSRKLHGILRHTHTHTLVLDRN